jgi:hypothetical protein
MPGYVPDPTDATRPTDADPAGTADDEFRALKARINALVLATGTRIPVRQCALTGPLNGVISDIISASATALGVDLKATSSPVVLTWANGFGANGGLDSVQVIGNDLANQWAALAVSNTTFLALDYVDGVTNPTAVKTLAAPQYGTNFDRTRQSLVHFDGAAAATAFLDDFGNVWAAQAGAKLQTNQVKFGSAALGGAGGTNTLNGSTDRAICTGITRVGRETGWSARAWVYQTTLPIAGESRRVFSAGAFGFELFCNNNAGTIRWAYNLSSNGAANDIALIQVGTSLPAINTWYFVELTYDALAGTYRLYVNGAQEASTASASKICELVGGVSIGGTLTGAANAGVLGYVDEFELLPYCDHPAGTAYAVPTAAKDVTVQGYATDWFDTLNYKMYQVSAASTVAGSNPTFTQKNRLYIGEADTSGVAVTAVRPYAYAGQVSQAYTNPLTAANAAFAFSHNLGTVEYDAKVEVRNIIGEAGYTPGHVLDPYTIPAAGSLAPFTPIKARNAVTYDTGNSAGFAVISNLTSLSATLTAANWQQHITIKRKF